jgi:REP element-mobilizing transposase RayT
MEKKEAHLVRPHAQQPGQAHFVTFSLYNTVAPGALSNYTDQLRELRWKIDNRIKHQLYDSFLKELESQYSRTQRHYFNAYDRLLAQNTDLTIDLNRAVLSEIIIQGITFWEDSLLKNYALCIMPNHVHWVFRISEKDKDGETVYLSNILESVKRDMATKINKVLEREGPLWQTENFDILLQNQKQLYRAIEFTLNNPVSAKYVKDRNKWPASWWSLGL